MTEFQLKTLAGAKLCGRQVVTCPSHFWSIKIVTVCETVTAIILVDHSMKLLSDGGEWMGYFQQQVFC